MDCKLQTLGLLFLEQVTCCFCRDAYLAASKFYLIILYMKKTFILWMLVGFVGIGVAQAQQESFRLGIKGGVNFTSFYFKGSDFTSENKAGFFIGPIIYFRLPVPGLAMNVAGLYNQHEAKFSDATVIQRTFDIPVNVRYFIPMGEKFSLFAEAGPQIAYTLGDRTFNFKDSDFGQVNWRLKDSNISANIGGGINVAHLQIGISYNVSLGKTGDFQWNDATEHQLLHTSSKVKSWQISAAYYF